MKDHYLPWIIKESSAGYYRVHIADEMMQNRELLCVGEIDEGLTYSLCTQLRYLNNADRETPITMIINSPGGEVAGGLAIYDVMKAIEAPVRTICLGMAYSMGALLFMAGDDRQMMPHAKVMIHDPLINNVGGSALELKTISDNLMKVREITGAIIAGHTNKKIEEILELTGKDTYFTAEEAVRHGIADSIIEKF